MDLVTTLNSQVSNIKYNQIQIQIQMKIFTILGYLILFRNKYRKPMPHTNKNKPLALCSNPIHEMLWRYSSDSHNNGDNRGNVDCWQLWTIRRAYCSLAFDTEWIKLFICAQWVRSEQWLVHYPYASHHTDTLGHFEWNQRIYLSSAR